MNFDMGIIDKVKSIASMIQKVDNIELYKTILDLQANVMELVEENGRLKSDLAEFSEKLKTKESLFFEHDAYWSKKADGTKDGPFCSNCWDSKQKLIRLHLWGNDEYSGCPNCQKTVHMPWRSKGEQRSPDVQSFNRQDDFENL
jgi:regulator of replication initiation timing